MSANLYAELEEFNSNEAHNVSQVQNSNTQLDRFVDREFENQFAGASTAAPAPALATASENLYAKLEQFNNNEAHNVSQVQNSNTQLDRFVDWSVENELGGAPAGDSASDIDDDDDDDRAYTEIIFPVTAFNRRIRECEIINYGYKDIIPFLLSAFDLYEPEVFEAVVRIFFFFARIFTFTFTFIY
jgi:hypothetical protein